MSSKRVGFKSLKTIKSALDHKPYWICYLACNISTITIFFWEIHFIESLCLSCCALRGVSKLSKSLKTCTWPHLLHLSVFLNSGLHINTSLITLLLAARPYSRGQLNSYFKKPLSMKTKQRVLPSRQKRSEYKMSCESPRWLLLSRRGPWVHDREERGVPSESIKIFMACVKRGTHQHHWLYVSKN